MLDTSSVWARTSSCECLLLLLLLLLPVELSEVVLRPLPLLLQYALDHGDRCSAVPPLLCLEVHDQE